MFNQASSKILFALGMSLLSLSCSKTEFGLQDQNQSFDSVVTYNNQVDVLVVVDSSPSMRDNQAKLSNESGSIIDALNAARMDYNIAVINSDMRTGSTGGKFLFKAGTPKFLTRETPNLKDIFRDRILTEPTSNGAEQGLASIEAVLRPSYANGAGSGFIRSEALLAIISLSDEDDQSTSKDWVKALDLAKPRFKSGLRGWIVNYIGLTSQTGSCTSNPNFISVGARWMALAEASGGVSASICDSSLALAANNIRSRIVQIRTDFPLERLPRADSIVVFIDGQPVPKSNTNGYVYFADGNFIRFYGRFVPGPDSKLKVDYAPLGAG